jgi:hypothetical protein
MWLLVMSGTVLIPLFTSVHICSVGRDGSVGMTRYGLDGPGIESRWRRDFPHPSRPALGPTHLLNKGYRVFLRGRATGRGVYYPPPFSAEVKKRVEPYLYSPFEPSWPFLGKILAFLLPSHICTLTSVTWFLTTAVSLSFVSMLLSRSVAKILVLALNYADILSVHLSVSSMCSTSVSTPQPHSSHLLSTL